VHDNLSIQDFLLAYAIGDASGPTFRTNQVVPLQRGGTNKPRQAGLTLSRSSDSRLRAEILRHLDRTTTVVTTTGLETTTRCQACAEDTTHPCRPYAAHPAYQRRWHIDPPAAAPSPAVGT
jgi:hypothetical protein